MRVLKSFIFFFFNTYFFYKNSFLKLESVLRARGFSLTNIKEYKYLEYRADY